MKKIIVLFLSIALLLSFCACDKYPDFEEVYCGVTHSGALDKDGNLWLWGDNYYGQMGNGKSTTYSEDVSVVENNDIYRPKKMFENVKAASLGEGYTLVLDKNGELKGFGRNDKGQLADGTLENRFTPVKIMDNIEAVSAGEQIAAAIDAHGDLFYWGEGANYEIVTEPTLIAHNVKSVSAGSRAIAFIDDKGNAYGIGQVSYLGIGGFDPNEFTNEPVFLADNVKKVSCGDQTTYYIDENDTLYGAGANGFSGGVGSGNEEFWIYYFEEIARDVAEVYARGCMYLKNDGSLYAWNNISNVIDYRNNAGEDIGGQLQDNEIVRYGFTPVFVEDDVVSASGGGSHSMYIESVRDIFSWGLNTYGRLGNGKSTVITRKTIYYDDEHTEYEYITTENNNITVPTKID